MKNLTYSDLTLEAKKKILKHLKEGRPHYIYPNGETSPRRVSALVEYIKRDGMMFMMEFWYDRHGECTKVKRYKDERHISTMTVPESNIETITTDDLV